MNSQIDREMIQFRSLKQFCLLGRKFNVDEKAKDDLKFQFAKK